MKHKFNCLALLLLAALMLFSADAFGQRRKYPEFHYLTLPISAGYSNYLSPGFKNEVSTFRNPGLLGTTLGIGYEFRHRMFWMGLDLEAQLISSRLRPGMARLDTMMYDTDTYYPNPQRENTYHYDFKKWYDEQIGAYGCFAMMFGIRANAFYIGIGAKVGYNFYATSTPHAQYKTSSTYDRYIVDFEDMPNHYLGEYKSGQTNNGNDTKFDFNLNVAATFEVGYEVYHSDGTEHVRPWILKLGAYAEYGFLSAYSNNGNVKPEFDYPLVDDNGAQVQDPSQLLITPFYKAHSTNGVNINPLYIGAKLTFMFDLPVPQKCHCLQSERGASWRNMAPKDTQRQNKHAKKNVKKQKSKIGDKSENSNIR